MAHSELEETLLGQIRMVGLPEPVRNYQFAKPRRWEFDLAWPYEYDYEREHFNCVAVEVEGGTWGQKCADCGDFKAAGRHVRGRGFERDCEKINEALLRGWRVFRFTAAMIESGEAVRTLGQALGRTE